MTTVTYSSGYSTNYDETLKIGDLVTTYNAGYHIITNIEDRSNTPALTPLIHYTKVYNDDGTPSKKLRSKCDGSFVRAAQEGLATEINESQSKLDALTKILNTLK